MAPSFLTFLDHAQAHHSRYDSSGRAISPSRKPLPNNTQHSQQTDIHDLGVIRTHYLSRRAAAVLRLRPRGYWDRPYCPIHSQNSWHFLSPNIHCCSHNSLQIFTILRQPKSVQNIAVPYLEIRLNLPSHLSSCILSLVFVSDCLITFFMHLPLFNFVLIIVICSSHLAAFLYSLLQYMKSV